MEIGISTFDPAGFEPMHVPDKGLSSYRALRSKSSHKIQMIVSKRMLYLLTCHFAKSFVLQRIRLLLFFSTFGWCVLEIFYQAFFLDLARSECLIDPHTAVRYL